MIGARSSGVLRRKKDKKVEAKKSVHARMQLVARVYLCFREIYSNQTEVKLTDLLDNAADTYRRETIGILGSAVNKLTERSTSVSVSNWTERWTQSKHLKFIKTHSKVFHCIFSSAEFSQITKSC